MKYFTFILIAIVIVGCTTDVSTKFPHSNLVETVWQLKQDAYIMKYHDERGRYYLVPCSTNQYSGLFPDRDYVFNEENIGRTINGKTWVGGLQKGEQVRIIRVLKDPNPEIGTRFYPIAIPLSHNRWVDDNELNMYWLYDGFESKGVLNPVNIEKVIN